jgi:ATP/maltotriose-dependent transcriptional regulator MalT
VEKHQQLILERVRLVELLDAIDARVTLILAPAGYGKTTAARQWFARHHDAVWYRADASSRDVATLALSLAQSLSVARDGLRQIRALQDRLSEKDAGDNEVVRLVADALTLRDEHTPVLVIDDYDMIESSPAAAALMGSLVATLDLRMVVIARRRPSWATARRFVYGEVNEIGPRDLAFTEEETAALFIDRPPETVRLLWTRSQGWPAALRLAALADAKALPEESYTVSLYDYFADELHADLSPLLQTVLGDLARLPNIDDVVLRLVMGQEVDQLRREALASGFISEPEVGKYELHPLLREFLIHKAHGDFSQTRCAALITQLIEVEYWDNAFALVRDSEIRNDLRRLLEAALDPLLHEARLTTLADWIRYAHSIGLDHPSVLLAEAELARRSGNLAIAEQQALHAATAYAARSHPWASRAYAHAGVCAHLLRRTEDALFYQRQARATAQTSEDARHAAWAELVIHHEVESRETPRLVRELETLDDGSPASILRVATGHRLVAYSHGNLDTGVGRQAKYLELCELTDDVFARSSFLYQLGYGYGLVGRYTSALKVIEQADELVRREHLNFAITHFLAARICATIGLRRWRRAGDLIESLEHLADRVGDVYERGNAQALRARLFLSTGRPECAEAELANWKDAPGVGLRAESAALLALSLTYRDARATAEELADRALREAYDPQGHSLARATQAVIDLRSGLVPAASRVVDFADVLESRGNYDSLVLAYRTYPPLLSAIVELGRPSRSRLVELVADARDFRVGPGAGWLRPNAPRVNTTLTRREEEVYELICNGRTNREIAASLFISEATVKVHVKHILEKLDVRSRTEAVIKSQEA